MRNKSVHDENFTFFFVEKFGVISVLFVPATKNIKPC